MNCSDVQNILNEHKLPALSAAERSTLDAHLADCGACFAEVSAQRLLLNESAGVPPAGLLESILAEAPAAATPRAGHRSPLGWQAAGGLAAAAALLLVVIFAASDRPPAGIAEDPIADTADVEVPAEDGFLAQPFVEGEHFVALPVAGRFSDLGNRVSAWIYFMWSCLHCYELEPILAEWVAQHDAAAVDVAKVPVVWNDYAELHARAFYSAGILGISDRVSDAVFESIHQNGVYLDTREAIRSLFLGFGVDGAVFDATFDSERVEDLLSLARFGAAEAQIDATPTMVVGGVYKTSPAMAGSSERMLQVADWLIAEITAEKARSPSCDIARERASNC